MLGRNVSRPLPSAGFNFILAISILGSSIENAKSSNSLGGTGSDFNTTVGCVVLCKNGLFKNGGVGKFDYISQESGPKIFLNLVKV